jgi:hypothetical protein
MSISDPGLPSIEDNLGFFMFLILTTLDPNSVE